MEKAHFDQTGGFPLETNTLNFLQKSHFLLSKAITGIAGNLVILEGCKKNGNLVESGIIAIDGEVLTFKGGTLGNYVIIKETKEARTFENGESKDVYFSRIAVFGTGSPMYKWSDFKYLKDIRELSADRVYYKHIEILSQEDLVLPSYADFFGKDCRIYIDSNDWPSVSILAPDAGLASEGCLLHVCVSPSGSDIYLETTDAPFLYKNGERTKIQIGKGEMFTAIKKGENWVFYD